MKRAAATANRPPVPREGTAETSADDFRGLVDTIADYAIFMLDPEGRVTSWNRGAEHIKGYRAEEILGEDFSLFFPPEDLAADKPHRELRLATEQGRSEDEGWRVRKDGTRFWANTVITALRNEAGELRGFVKVTRDLTARRQADEALRQSNERLRLMIDSIRDHAIVMLDEAGRVQTWNPGAERVHGYRASEIIGQHLSRFYLEDDVRVGKPGAELGIASDIGRFETEDWRRRSDGTRYLADVVLGAVKDDTGKLVGFTSITRDVTERRRAEDVERQLFREQAARAAAERIKDRLRDSEERYRQLSHRLEVILESIPDGITVQSDSESFVFANSAAARSLGFASTSELLSTPVSRIIERYEIMDEQHAPVPTEALPSVVAGSGGAPPPTPLWLRDRVTGKQWWALVRSTAIRRSSGEPELTVTMWHDITLAKRREEWNRFLADATTALSSSLDYEQTLTGVAAAIVPGLADWCAIHIVEGGALKLVAVAHIDPEKVDLAKQLYARFPPDLSRTHGVANVVRTGVSELTPELTPERIEGSVSNPELRDVLCALGLRSAMIVPLKARDRTFGAMTLISVEARQVYDDDDLAVAEEVGRRAGIAMDNARLYGEARSAVQLRDEFLSIAGHELKTPLAALQLQMQSVQRAFERGDRSLEKWIERLRKGVAQAKRLERLIGELLDVSRLTSGRLALEREQIDLAAVLRDVLERHSDDLLRSGSELRLDVPEPAVGFWDGSRLDQVISNLVSNAIKYGEGKPIEIALDARADSVDLTITDHGIGIPIEAQKRIFGRFERAVSDRHYGGFGLGLWIVQEIVHAHGGAVGFRSAPGQGATFTVSLPRTSSDAPGTTGP